MSFLCFFFVYIFILHLNISDPTAAFPMILFIVYTLFPFPSKFLTIIVQAVRQHLAIETVDEWQFLIHLPFTHILVRLFVNIVRNYYAAYSSKAFSAKIVNVMRIKSALNLCQKIARAKKICH